MDRRKAIKNIAATFGCIVATPTLLNILVSCSNKEATTSYFFLNQTQSNAIDFLNKIIVPITDFPAVKKMQLTQFIDQMFYHTVTKEEQTLFNKGSQHFETVFKSTYSKSSLDGNIEEFNQLFKHYFKISKQKQTAVLELLAKDINDVSPKDKPNYLLYEFFTSVRYYCLFGYCTSEVFIEENLY